MSQDNQTQDLNDLEPSSPKFEEKTLQLRKEKREDLQRITGQSDPYPNNFQPVDRSKALNEAYPSAESLGEKKVSVSLGGRILALRQMGKGFFADLHDTHGKIQLYVNKKQVDEKAWETFMHLDLGDIVGVEGTLFFTRTGQLTVTVESIQLTSKCLLPLPEKFSGIKDREIKYRQRYLDLATDPKVRQTFQLRSQVISQFRGSLQSQGYMEVETPMMQPLRGGATAKPFVTHYQSLDADFYLRVAPELNLKRLLVGGFDRVFEINRNFRNEGISTRHSPEFTMLEWYTAWSDYQKAMDLTESVLRSTLQLEGVTSAAKELLDRPFKRISMEQAVQTYLQATSEQMAETSWLVAKAEALGADSGLSRPQALYYIFDEKVESTLKEPVFIYGYPSVISPLAKVNREDPLISDRFELFINGWEIANSYSELNDPDLQHDYFQAQEKLQSSGDEESMDYDADYVKALQYGMPPAAGVGVGIDRWLMLLTESTSIRDVILFPHLRQETK